MTWLWATQWTPPGESLDEVVTVIVGYIRREDSKEDMVREAALRDWGAERIVWEKLTKRLDRAGVGFASLKEDFYTATNWGKETMRVMTALAEIEEEWLRHRGEQIQKARDAGCYKGRTPLKVDEEKFRAVCTQWRAGELTAVAAMEQMGLKPNTFYRRVRERGW